MLARAAGEFMKPLGASRRFKSFVLACLAMGGVSGAPLAAPGEVHDVVWCPGAKDCLDWSDVADAAEYELFRGWRGDLPFLLDPSPDSCRLGSYAVSTSGRTLAELPGPGEMMWFLARAVNAEGPGSVGEATDGPREMDPTGDCVPASCRDGIANGDETDVDCGGSVCGPCADGRGCQLPRDCIGRLCTNGLCDATCSDGLRNQDESDVDCGGTTCAACLDGRRCVVPADCVSGWCLDGVCQATCSDGIPNQDETDVDCGGSVCPRCLDGKACLVPTDCISELCTDGYCESTCTDGIWGGDESDVDCGGPVCPACPDGSMCGYASDCQSGVCDGHCLAATCEDQVQNGEETGVDCGGPVCPPCP